MKLCRGSCDIHQCVPQQPYRQVWLPHKASTCQSLIQPLVATAGWLSTDETESLISEVGWRGFCLEMTGDLAYSTSCCLLRHGHINLAVTWF